MCGRKTCSVEGCNREAITKGYCSKHYQKFKKYGDPLAGRINKKISGKADECCSVEGCNRTKYSNGLCIMHWGRYIRNGDPNIVLREIGKYEFCTVEGCSEPHHANGLCKKHWMQEYWQTENGKEAKIRGSHTRRARMLGAEVEDFTSKEIFERDNFCCGICNLPVDPELVWPHPGSPTLDHVVPLARGGNHTRDNVQLAHLRCNQSKNDKLPEEYEAYVGNFETQQFPTAAQQAQEVAILRGF